MAPSHLKKSKKNYRRESHFLKISVSLLIQHQSTEVSFDGSNEIPVLISTTWSQHDLAKSINHTSEELAQSVLDGNILNVTMSLEWKTGYKELGKDKSTPRGETVEKFSKIWKRSGIPEFTNGQISVATNNKSSVYPCGVVIEGLTKQACEDDSWPKITYVHPLEKFLPFDQKWYQFDTKPTASGITSNISYGFNRTGNTYFINFTVLFSIWTFDFPNGFLYNYRDQSFVNEKTMLEIFYWKTEVVKPECPLPTYLPTIFYLMIGPATVLVLSLVLRLLTCSKHAFNIKVWQFKNKNKNVDEVFSEWKKKSQRIAKEKNQERARDMLRKDGFDLDYVGPEKQI
ncbi:uncharacterized protein LOC130623616 isoform X2 [Hydractinia symbiolongicarpus]|uniref:uncharacterized protein LOC130623616 isoform X2 n=1 Tax=Hydractinia symbiolongicarpus TaxID=13093 RepID=UPI002549E74E|nr:uncharacterized protein LOC130623616 isoform X2 [Hydractinia symbiolongicarpus]